jgi:hypothetical protein
MSRLSITPCSRLVDSRTAESKASTTAAFAAIQRIGGKTGWYYGSWLWRVRGFLDLLVGAVGVRRGRRDPVNIHVGDALDFWRVEAFEPGHLLRLRAEMKVPSRACLEFEVTEHESQHSLSPRRMSQSLPSSTGTRVGLQFRNPIHRGNQKEAR